MVCQVSMLHILPHMQAAAITIIYSIAEDIFASDANPIGVCDYVERESICINAIYNSGFSILSAVVLLIVDLIIISYSPSVCSTISYSSYIIS